MRLTPNAVCMASSAPNPYGQPQAPPVSPTPGNIYYGDYNQVTNQVPIKSPGAFEVTSSQQQQVGVCDTTKRAAHHSSSSLAGSYDNYISGMSSDSELTTTSTSARHHHHRPYSSQSRVYHAHPVPRNPPASSVRLSHFSSNSTANVQAIPQQQQHSSAYSIRHQQQLNNQPSSTTPPSNQPAMSSISHQNSFASAGSISSSSYLPAMTPADSPISPVLASHQQQQQQQQPLRAHKSGSGRQLPQRPFKQSMSIDHHSLSNQYKSPGQMTSQHHSPAHQPSIGMHRNLTGDQIGVYQQKSYPTAPSHQLFESTNSLYNEPSSQRNLRYDMSLMEKQAANMSLYDAGGDRSMAELPPTGPVRSSSAASRHMPSTSQTQSLMMDQQQIPSAHHQVDIFHHQHQYAGPSQVSHHHTKTPSGSSSEWLPSIGGTSNPVMGLARGSANQFKHTMSIDHYSAVRHQQQQQQQQQQRHFSPARQNQSVSTEQYHSLGSYAGLSSNQSPMMSGSNYDPMMTSQVQDCFVGQDMAQDQVKYHHYPSQSSPINPSLHHQAASSLEHTKTAYDKIESVGGGTSTKQATQHPSARLILQHQPSSSSSNSNLSGSLNSNNVENITNLDGRPQGPSSEHQKSISSASSHYQPSPQHKAHSATRHYPGTRQDLLRRGYTSITTPVSAYGGDFGGSQSALSESGDPSMSAHGSLSGQSSGKRNALRAASPSLALEASSSSGPHHHGHHQHHSTSSGYGIRDNTGIRSESSTGLPNGSGSSSTLTKKSNSATQLSMTGTKKRLGFRKKQVTSFSVHRSEEVAPLEARHLVKQGSSVSEGDSSMSGDSSSRSWSNSNFKQQTSEELASISFIDGLGKGQMISRQGLASPYLGDIQLSLCDRRGNLEIEIIRARNLQAKTNKIQPLTYVKLYLVKNRKCLAKAKTTLSNKRTLNPLFQQQLTFHEDYHGCILQSIVWGNFGKMDKKNFMGIAQISIDDLELSDTVISWYKLFLPSSLQTLPSKSLRHTLLSNSTESFTNTQNS